MLDGLILMVVFVLLAIGMIFLLRARKLKRLLAMKEEECQRLSEEIVKVSSVANELAAKFSGVLDAKAEAEKIYAQARAVESSALNSAKEVMDRAEQHAKAIRQDADE